MRDEEDPRRGQTPILIMQSLIKLYKLNHKPIIRTSNPPPLFDIRLSPLIIPSIRKDKIGNHKGNRSRYTLYAMNEDVLAIAEGCIDEIYDPIEQAFDVFVLGVFEEEC